MDSPEVLGSHAFVTALAVRGPLTEQVCADTLCDIARSIGMKSDGLHKATWRYPAFGAGGEGLTMVQPIVESFLAWDTWSEHGGGYLFVVSCRLYQASKIRLVLEAHGLEVIDEQRITLAIDGHLERHPPAAFTDDVRGRAYP